MLAKVTATVPAPVTVEGLRLAVNPDADDESTEKVTGPLNPPTGTTLTVATAWLASEMLDCAVAAITQ